MSASSVWENDSVSFRGWVRTDPIHVCIRCSEQGLGSSKCSVGVNSHHNLGGSSLNLGAALGIPSPACLVTGPEQTGSSGSLLLSTHLCSSPTPLLGQVHPGGMSVISLTMIELKLRCGHGVSHLKTLALAWVVIRAHWRLWNGLSGINAPMHTRGACPIRVCCSI